MAVLLLVGALAGSAVSQWRATPAAPTAPGQAGGPSLRAPDERVRVEVLNGGGRPDMARRATDHLRELGFDVVYYGNAETFGRDTTVVLDRVGRDDFAHAVARALGAGATRVRAEPDSARFVDVTVVLGASWDPPVRRSPATPSGGTPAWWDLRRLLPEGREGRPDDAPARMVDPPNGGS